jgi:hypothetical protein
MAEEILEGEYPGIGRLHYFLAQVVMIAAVIFVVTAFGPDSQAMRFTSLGVMIASMIVDTLRLRNIGVSQWLVFVRYLPFGGMLLSMALTSAQTGWNETRKLDSAGKSILTVELILFAMMMFLAIRSGIQLMGFPGWSFPIF